MAKIREPFLFNWQNVEAKSDLDRLRLVFEHLPDEELMQKLEKHRRLDATSTQYVLSETRSWRG